jgi:hypothetical protein
MYLKFKDIFNIINFTLGGIKFAKELEQVNEEGTEASADVNVVSKATVIRAPLSPSCPRTHRRDELSALRLSGPGRTAAKSI